jgi:endonuclease/exonuclease/phosphatase family metal-dependent hydrolase
MLSMLLVSAAVMLPGTARSQALVHTPLSPAAGAAEAAPRQLRAVSYNIKSAAWHGDRLEDLALVLQRLDGDVVALQEVQGRENQAVALAKRLGYAHHAFAATLQKGAEDYGVALLSRYPIEAVERVELVDRFAFEPRVAIVATVRVGGRRLRVVCTHADVLLPATRANTRDLAAALKPYVGEGLLLMGDLNAQPSEKAVRTLTDIGLHDLFAEKVPDQTWPTFPSDRPRKRIDYFLVDGPLQARAAAPEVPVDTASDHRPIAVTFDLTGWSPDSAPRR